MANSSDWLDAVLDKAKTADGDTRNWLNEPVESAGFVLGLPVARSNALEPEPVQEPEKAASLSPNSEPALSPEPNVPQPDPAEEAYVRGHAEGRAQAEAEYENERSHRRALRLNLASLDSAAMDALASDLVETVIALCNEAISEFTVDGKTLSANCRSAATRLGGLVNGCALHLHPADVELLEEGLVQAWQIVPNEGMERGSLKFESPDGSIEDGPAEWRRIIASALRG